MTLQEWCAQHRDEAPETAKVLEARFKELTEILTEADAVLGRIEEKFDLTALPKLAARIAALRKRVQE